MLKKNSLKKKTLAAMLAAVSDHMSMMDRDLNILWANDTAKRLFGDDLVGKKCYQAYHRRSTPCENCCIVDAFEGKQKCEHETQVIAKDGNVLHYHCSASVALRDEEGRPTAVLEISRNITEQKRVMVQLKKADRILARRLFLEELMSAASGRFVGLYDIDEAIYKTLEDIGSASGASRSYLFIFKQNGELMDNTHEWCAPGVSPEKDNLQDLPASTIPWWMKMLKQERLIHITDVDSLPEAAAAEREILQAQNIKSLIVLPVVIGAEIAGFIGFDNVERSGAWTNKDISVLKMVAEIFGSALERKRAEESLKESEERWRSLVQSAPETVVTLDREHRISFINRTVPGVTPEQVLGKNIVTLIPDEFQDEARRCLEQVFTTGEPVVFECPGIAGIDPSWYMSRIGPIYKDGEVAAAIVVSTNITSRKKMEDGLHRDKYMLQQTLFGLSDAAFLLDAEKITIRDCNKAATKVFGYSREEMVGRTTEFMLVDDKDLDEFRKHLFPAVERNGYVSGLEFTLKRKDGSIFTSEHGIMPISDEEGKRIGWVSVVRDITDRKQAELSLERRLWELKFLNDMAIEFSSISSIERLNIFICEKLKGFTGAMFTGMCQFDVKTQSLVLEHILTDSASLNAIQKIVGRTIKSMKFPVPPEMLERMKEQRVERLAGLDELTFGTIPKPVNFLVEKTLGIDGVYAMLFAEGDNVLGTSVSLLPRDHVPLTLESLKTFAHLAAASMQRVQVEEELARSEAKFRTVADYGYNWETFRDSDGKLLYISPAFERITGYKLDDYMSGAVTFNNLIHPDDLKAAQRFFARALKGESFENLELRMIHRDGRELFMSISSQPVTTKDGTRIGMRSSIVDITARKQAAEALRISEEQFKALYRANPVPIYTWKKKDGDFELVEYNDAAFAFTQGQIVNLMGSLARELYRDQPEIHEDIHRAYDERTIIEREMEYRLISTGEDKFLSVKYAFAEPDLVLIHTEDVTERTKAEEALRESEERYRTLVSNIPGAVYRCDENWTMLFLSDVIQEISGYPSSDFIDDRVRSFASIMHAEDIKMVEKSVADCLAENKPIEVEYRIILADGSIRWIHDKAQGIVDETGKLLWFDGMVFDITSKKQAEEALRESEEKFKKVVSTSPDAIMVFEAKTRRFVEVNEACEKLYGYTRNEFLKMKHQDITAERKKSEQSIALTVNDKLDHIPLRYHRKKAGTVFPVEISAGRFEYRGRTVLCGVVRDISERFQLEREIVQISSQEQQRIGQDLHDGLGQELTGISCMLKALEESLKEKKAEEAGDVSRILKLVEQTITQAHDLARGLHPVDLEEQGLMMALGQMGAKIGLLNGINCNFVCNRDVSVKDGSIALNLYRIAQEAVTNAVKHARARNIEILLAYDGEQLVLKVQDDGKGIDLVADESKRMGLRIMEYRAGQCGGSLSIDPAPNGGTVITCSVPYGVRS